MIKPPTAFDTVMQILPTLAPQMQRTALLNATNVAKERVQHAKVGGGWGVVKLVTVILPRSPLPSLCIPTQDCNPGLGAVLNILQCVISMNSIHKHTLQVEQ